MSSDLLIQEFGAFKEEVNVIYKACESCHSGNNADYIPELANVDSSHWGVAVCTVDGQRYKKGHSNTSFSIQSTSKPMSYAFAMEQSSDEYVHKHVGKEPSGVRFNALIVDDDGLPHNPVINAGAIMVASLLWPEEKMLSARFAKVQDMWRRMAGGKKFNYDQKVYLSESGCAWGNKALAALMMNTKAFPDGTDPEEALDFYFMLCSLESDADRMSIVAATLANNGKCPLTGDQVLSPRVVRDTLSIMFCCGMYDYSGQFAFNVGMPAKSGVSGALIVVVPGVLGYCTYSPRLDNYGNSSRGVMFSELLEKRFKFHTFNLEQDNLVSPFAKDLSFELIESSGKGDLRNVQAIIHEIGLGGKLIKEKVERGDYDGRTALHLAASEGRSEIVKYLLETSFYENADMKDRFGNTPFDDAISNQHLQVARIIKDHYNLTTPEGLWEKTPVGSSSYREASFPNSGR